MSLCLSAAKERYSSNFRSPRTRNEALRQGTMLNPNVERSHPPTIMERNPLVWVEKLKLQNIWVVERLNPGLGS
jgi:hypothetical protein